MGKTLRRYLLREIGGAFVAGIAILSSILFLVRVLDLIEMIFARGVPAALVARLLAAILPSFLEATLPMAFLLGIVTALGRLASDNETLALRAAGLDVRQMLPPILGLSLLVAAVTLVLAMTARPWGHQQIVSTAFEIAKTRASAALRPRFFNTEFERMVVYVDRIDPGTGDLLGVLLSDERAGRATVFAARGAVGAHEESGRLFLRLLDGTSVWSRENAADYDVTEFRSLDVSLQLRTVTGSRPDSDEPAALTWSELAANLSGDDPKLAREAAIERHRRFSISAAAVALALIGAALGLQPGREGRGRPVAAGIFLILFFYGLLTVGIALARSGTLPPAVAVWMADALLLAAGLLALSRVRRDLAVLPRLRRDRATHGAAA